MISRAVAILSCIYLIFTGPFWVFHLPLPPMASLENPPAIEVGLVLGASVRENSYPSDVLRQRLDKGAEAYNQGLIQKILVSGDNRALEYDEPKVMKSYLVERGVPASDIIQDFAGRRTLDSCWRAKNVFKLNQVVIITQPFHMPRSLFLCTQMGLKTSYLIAENSRRRVTVTGIIREIPASWLAIFDVLGEQKAEVEGDGTEITGV
jgi:SanA protein